MSPTEAEREENGQKLDAINEKYISKFFWKKKVRPRYSVNQLVRISQERTPFFKGYNRASYKNESREPYFDCRFVLI